MSTESPLRPATIEDVATAAGVSRAAVSKVIRGAYGVSPAMYERVTAAIDELDYRPRVSARGMRGSTFTLGIELPDFFNQFFPKLIDGATAHLAGGPYQLIVAPADRRNPDGYRAIQALADRQVDGVVAITPGVKPEWLEKLSRHLPLVMIGRHDESVGYDTLVGDDDLGTRLAIRHLIDQGHRKIAHVTLTRSHTDWVGTPHQIRADSYVAAMTEAGLHDHIDVVRAWPGELAAYQASLELLASPDRPTAVFAAHDEPALGVLRALTELGLTAADIAVVGYDDTELASHPRMSLTSVNQSGTAMGARAVGLLLERIAGRTVAAHEVMMPRLMVRESSTGWNPQRPGR